MTVSTLYSPDSYLGDGANDTFAVTFKFNSLKVSIKDSAGIFTEKTLATHYTIVGSNVVFTAGNIPSGTDTVVIELDADFLQSSDYRDNSRLPAETLESDLDTRCLESQLNKDRAERSLKLDPDVDLSGKSLNISLPSSGESFVIATSTGLSSKSAVSLGAITLPLSVSQGGTGVSTLEGDEVLTGNGTSAPGSSANVKVVSDTLQVSNSTVTGGKVDFVATDSDVCTLKGPDTLSSDVTVTLPSSTTTLVGTSEPATITSKSLNADNNSITNIGSSEIKTEMITGQSTISGDLQSGDFILIYDASTASMKKVAATDIASSSAQILISTGTVLSGQATVSFTGLSSDYKKYVLEIINVVPVSNATLRILTSSDNGVSYDSGVSDYTFSNHGYHSSTILNADYTSDYIQVGEPTVNVSNRAADGGISGTVGIIDPSSTSTFCRFSWQVAYAGTSIHSNASLNGSGARKSTSAVNAVRLQMSTGNMSSGVVKLYGVK